MAAKQKQSSAAVQYTQDELILHAEQLFGVKPEAVRGALVGYEQQTLSLEQAAQRVQQFMKRKVLV